MTLQEFRDLLLTADPQAVHYKSMKNVNYTRWQEFRDKALIADSVRKEKVWKIQVDRFTKDEYDPVVDLINSALDRDDISYEYLVDFEPETSYIHHIWDCEVV